TLQFFELTQGLEQAWSMGVELSWYVFLPILAIVLHGVVPRVPERHRLKAHVGILMVAAPVSAVYLSWAQQPGNWDSAAMWLPRYLICFALGAVVGLMMDAERAGATDISRGRKIMTDPWLLPMLALVFAAVALSEWSGPVAFTKLTLAQEYVRDGAGIGLAGTLLIISAFSGPGAP